MCHESLRPRQPWEYYGYRLQPGSPTSLKKIALKRTGIVAIHVLRKPSIRNISDNLLITIHVIDCSAVQNVVERQDPPVDRFGDGADGLHVRLSHPFFDQIELPLGLQKPPKPGIIIKTRPSFDVSFEYRGDLHKKFGVGHHVLKSLRIPWGVRASLSLA